MDEKILKSSITYKPPKTENLIEFLKDALTSHSKDVLLINGPTGICWNGEQIELAVGRVAKFLIDQCGINKGDVISVFGTDEDRVAIILLAIVTVGASCKLVSSTIKDVAATIRVSHPKLVITSNQYLDTLKNELSDYKGAMKFLSMDETEDGSSNIFKDLQSDNKEVGSTLDQLIESVPIKPDSDIAVIQFSSGTTGKPKRIPRTHKSLCHLVASVHHPELMYMKPGDKITGYLQLAFRTGLWAFLACLHSGATFVINYETSLDSVLKVIEKYKVNIASFSVVSLAEFSAQVSEKCKQYDLSSIKEIITAGAKIVNYNVAQNIVDVMKIDSLRQCFGMTESGWVFLIERSLAKNNYLTVGHVVPSTEAIVIDPETGRRLGPNEKGEIALRGPQIFSGYMTDDKDHFNRNDFNDEGWFKIGDQAYYTEEGLFYISGRYKELLIFSNMERYFPDEIEIVLLAHPDIKTACVVKVPGNHDDLYDAGRAYVTIRQGSNISNEDVVKFLNNEAPLIILDGGVRILESFPRLPNGKINKQALRTMT